MLTKSKINRLCYEVFLVFLLKRGSEISYSISSSSSSQNLKLSIYAKCHYKNVIISSTNVALVFMSFFFLKGELVTMYSSLPYLSKSGMYSVRLPNAFNFGFDFYSLVIVLMFSYIPSE